MFLFVKLLDVLICSHFFTRKSAKQRKKKETLEETFNIHISVLYATIPNFTGLGYNLGNLLHSFMTSKIYFRKSESHRSIFGHSNTTKQNYNGFYTNKNDISLRSLKKALLFCYK